MTVELRPRLIDAFRSVVRILLVVSTVALVGYPLYYLSLTASRQMLADLPQDLILVFLAGTLLVPSAVGWSYVRHRTVCWIVSEQGVEVLRHGLVQERIGWDRISGLEWRCGAMMLRFRSQRRPMRLPFIDPTLGAEAAAGRGPQTGA